jgi:hypothetical protein
LRAEWDFCEAVEDLLTSRAVPMFIDKADIKSKYFFCFLLFPKVIISVSVVVYFVHSKILIDNYE